MKAILLDDEYAGIENLKGLLQNFCPEIDVVATSQQSTDAKNLIENHQPELVFLDVSMPMLTGFDVLELFPDRNFEVIIVTAYDEYALPALKEGVCDYILKPISIKDLQKAIQKAQQRIDDKQKLKLPIKEINKIPLANIHGYELVDAESILYVEGLDNMAKVFLQNSKPVIVSKTLKDFEEQLRPPHFYRVHKSYIINVKHLKSLSTAEGSSVLLHSGEEIPVSRRSLKDFKDFLNQHK